jgi:hypothetical protein
MLLSFMSRISEGRPMTSGRAREELSEGNSVCQNEQWHCEVRCQNHRKLKDDRRVRLVVIDPKR